ncbi:MAG TPA: hypothetical protein VNV40_08160 [Steroidobacteraceae bacterium]|nr:hypothetical protein [Steroidobacteraceae bacterium]
MSTTTRWRRLSLKVRAGCAEAVARKRSVFGWQRRFGERVELLDRGARHAENLTATTPECDPGFERGNTFGAQALDQRQGQVSG